MNVDEEHLRLLTMGHYIVAAITGLFSLFPILHIAMGLAIVLGKFPQSPNDTMPRMMGWLFVAMGTAFVVGGLSMAVCLAFAGKFLAARTHRTFCTVVAAVACCFMPLGTILGVFTLVVLQRESVKQMFGASP
jgi:hypothetical protein